MNNLQSNEIETQDCECCDTGKARLTTELVAFDYGAGQDAVTLQTSMPMWTCDTCGERYTADGAEEAEYDAIAAHLGRLLPDEIIAFRRRAGLTQAELALKIEASRPSIARWETRTQLQSKMYDKTLREFMDKWRAASTKALNPPMFRTDVDHRRPAAEVFSLQVAA